MHFSLTMCGRRGESKRVSALFVLPEAAAVAAVREALTSRSRGLLPLEATRRSYVRGAD